MNRDQKYLNKAVELLEDLHEFHENFPTVNEFIDATLLQPTVTKDEIFSLCNSAITNVFRSVRVPPNFVSLAHNIIKGSNQKNILIGTVISFPFGYDTITTKRSAIIQALLDGADECDVVISPLIKKNFHIYEELSQYSDLARKVNIMPILEVSHFDGHPASLESLCKDIQAINFINYIKTSSGFNARKTVVGDIKFLKNINGDRFKLKASGGIKTWDEAKEFINSGANIIGTSSYNTIMEDYLKEKKELEDRLEEVELKVKTKDAPLH